jgi:glycosyl transferase family 2
MSDQAVDIMDKVPSDSENPMICIATLLRTSRQETIQFVNYHLNLGINHIYLFFDDPEDEAIGELSDRPGVSCMACSEDYWRELAEAFPQKYPLQKLIDQNVRMELASIAALRLAREAGHAWLILMDSDELLYLGQPLKRVFETAGQDVDVLRFAPLEGVPPKYPSGNLFLETNLFKLDRPAAVMWGASPSVQDLATRIVAGWATFIISARKLLARLLGCGKAFHYGYFKGHLLGKSAVRLSAPIISMKPHLPNVPAGTQLRACISPQAFVLHFDCRGFYAWKRKWEWRSKNPQLIHSTALSARREKQRVRFVELYQQGDEAGIEHFYDELYGLSPYQIRILKALGLLREIRLSEPSFAWIAADPSLIEISDNRG